MVAAIFPALSTTILHAGFLLGQVDVMKDSGHYAELWCVGVKLKENWEP